MARDVEIYREIARRTALGEAVALATVVKAHGSTPRDAGAKMVLASDGRTLGTVGGGYGEAAALAVAQEVLMSGQPRLVRVELVEDLESGSDALCGGSIEVLVERLGPAVP